MRYRFPAFRPPRVGAALVAVAAAWCLAAPARADVTTTFSDVNPGEVVTLSNGETGWAGQYNFTKATGNITGNFGSFCIDISQNIYGGQTVTFQLASLASAPNDGPNSPGMGALRAELIEELWYSDHTAALASASNAAAFQVAIWEIINETNTDPNGNLALDVTKGSFTVTDSDGATLTTANNWLQGINILGTGPKDTSLIALTNPNYQDYVTEGGNNIQSTPAPPGLALAGVAAVCGGLAAGWRRYRRPARGLTA